MKPAGILRASLSALLAFAPLGAVAAQGQAEWGAEESARWDFESALRMWERGLYGGLLFYHDGKGALSARLQVDMDAEDEESAKPAEWKVTSVDCPTENQCSATTLIRFTDEPAAGLRRYRLIREPGQFWGLHSEEILECPEGCRLQYQGICVNAGDEQSDDPDIEIRTVDPVVAG